tara:strand:+ start:3555 stop:4181 length:627 start_codon:yes stop_codon:yes gene_type:complete
MNFIYVKDNALSSKDCERAIKFFELNSKDHSAGRTSGGVNKEYKNSMDWCKWFPDKDALDIMFMDCMKIMCEEYKERHSALQHLPDSWHITPAYNMQKYEPGGGFYNWHCEHGDWTSFPDSNNIRRNLAWMIYLNDVPDGGTDFLEQDYTCEAKAGRAVLWPAYWTHTHKSQISNTLPKYIATGWFMFDIPEYNTMRATMHRKLKDEE